MSRFIARPNPLKTAGWVEVVDTFSTYAISALMPSHRAVELVQLLNAGAQALGIEPGSPETATVGDEVTIGGRVEAITVRGDLMIEVPGLMAEPFVRHVIVRPTQGIVRKADS